VHTRPGGVRRSRLTASARTHGRRWRTRTQRRPPGGRHSAVLNQGDQGGNLMPPSLILNPDVPDIPNIPDIGVPWVPSGA
jgi:hypothetical protein